MVVSTGSFKANVEGGKEHEKKCFLFKVCVFGERYSIDEISFAGLIVLQNICHDKGV